jgi:thiosulfate reductase cytochrome b subunit
MLNGPSGWGRYLHFLSAWVCVITGGVYVVAGLALGHFQREFVPEKSDWSWREISRVLGNRMRFGRPPAQEGLHYNVLQRLSYVGVVFVLLPVMLWTGMAMSPAIISVFPFFVTALGGQQTARTIHFFAAVLLVLFLFVHIAMVWLAGFKSRVGGMITGRSAAGKEPS